MNIFTKHEHIFGSPETEHLSRNLEEFFTLLNSLRPRLGTKAYLLNEYVRLILKSSASQPLHAAAEDSFLAANELFRIVSAILAEKPCDHPLYDDCRQLILSHPRRIMSKHMH